MPSVPATVSFSTNSLFTADLLWECTIQHQNFITLRKSITLYYIHSRHQSSTAGLWETIPKPADTYKQSHYNHNISGIHQLSEIGERCYLQPCKRIYLGHHISQCCHEQILWDTLVAFLVRHCQGMSSNWHEPRLLSGFQTKNRPQTDPKWKHSSTEEI